MYDNLKFDDTGTISKESISEELDKDIAHLDAKYQMKFGVSTTSFWRLLAQKSTGLRADYDEIVFAIQDINALLDQMSIDGRLITAGALNEAMNNLKTKVKRLGERVDLGDE